MAAVISSRNLIKYEIYTTGCWCLDSKSVGAGDKLALAPFS